MEQLRLAPEAPPVFVDELIPLDELPPNTELVGPAPDKALIDSIAQYGVIEPIIVEDQGDAYEITDGRRRVKAARLLNLEEIPARIYSHGDQPWMPSTLSIISHATRRNNSITEYEAIQHLIGTGHSEQEIARATGLTVQTVRKRMKLHGLNPALLDAAAAGEIAPGVAERAATLTAEQQDRLVALYEETGRVTAQNVTEARQVQREQATQALSFDAIQSVPTITMDTTSDVEEPAYMDGWRELIAAARHEADPGVVYRLAKVFVDAYEGAEEGEANADLHSA